MEVFCQECNFLNYSDGMEHETNYNIEQVTIRNGQEFYVCPNGHYIFKATVDLLGAKRMKELVAFGGVLADMVSLKG